MALPTRIFLAASMLLVAAWGWVLDAGHDRAVATGRTPSIASATAGIVAACCEDAWS